MLGDVIDKKSDAPVLLDVRNGYEWDVGHFRGAERPVQESFRETVETNVEEGSGPLAGVDKSRPIMMYCTGVFAATCTRRCSKSRDTTRCTRSRAACRRTSTSSASARISAGTTSCSCSTRGWR